MTLLLQRRARAVASVLLGAGGVVAVALLTALPASAQTVSCSISPQEDRTIVHLGVPDGEADLGDVDGVRSDKTEVDARFGPVDVSIPAGSYRITLQSYDTHDSSTDQPQERYYVLLRNGSTVVTETSAISDLPTEDQYKTEVVDTELDVNDALTEVLVRHPAYPDNSSANSIVPVCMAFDRLDVSGDTCPLSPQDDRTIIDIHQSIDEKLFADRGLEQSRYGPVAASLPAGLYDVTLVSYDNHGPGNNSTQNNERYRLSLYDGNSVVVDTSAISDIPDADQYRTEQVDEAFEVPSGVDAVLAVHDAYPGSGAESVTAVCAAFDLVELCEELTITTDLSREAVEGEEFTYVIEAEGTSPEITVGDLPDSLSFDGADTISGTLEEVGDFEIDITAENACSQDAVVLELSVDECVPIKSLPFRIEKRLIEGEFFEYEIPIGTTTHYTIDADDLPSGLDLEDNVISGTPREAGEFEIDIEAENACSQEEMTLGLDIDEDNACTAPYIDLDGELRGVENGFFDYDVTVDGGDDLEVRVSGLPNDLAFDEDDLLISGRLTEVGRHTVTVTAEDVCGEDETSFDIVVEDVPDEVCEAVFPNVPGTQFVQANNFFSYRITTRGGEYNRLFVTGLPAGITHTGQTVSGSPLTPGTYRITVTSVNDCGMNSDYFDLVVTAVGGVQLTDVPDTGPWADLAKSPALYSLVVFGGATILLSGVWGARARRRPDVVVAETSARDE